MSDDREEWEKRKEGSTHALLSRRSSSMIAGSLTGTAPGSTANHVKVMT